MMCDMTRLSRGWDEPLTAAPTAPSTKYGSSGRLMAHTRELAT
jgi:hypothetical protein